MAVWEVAIEKVLGGEYWLNVYHVDVSGQTEAAQAANEIVGVERGIHQENVGFTKFRVKQANAPGFPGTVYPIGLQGTAGVTTSLPLFVVVRFDFAVPVGRPSRKYIKKPVPTAWVDGNNFLPAALAAAQSTYGTPILGVEGLCDEAGQQFLSCTPQPVVGMRQLRRGTRKRTTPIIS